jgi:hypothetical protein
VSRLLDAAFWTLVYLGTAVVLVVVCMVIILQHPFETH